MRVRTLLELTVDLSNPAAELIDAISAVLGSLSPIQRGLVLRSLDEAVGVALSELEPQETEATA